MITRETLIERIACLPRAIAACELALLAEETERRNAAALLQAREDELLLTGQIEGKNAETRSAQLRQLTDRERDHLERLAELVAREKVSLRQLTDEFAALRVIARLIAPVE